MNTSQRLSQISAQDFLALGVNDLAYVKPIVVDDTTAFGVFAANGTQIAVLPSREVAITAVRQHDLEPVSVH